MNENGAFLLLGPGVRGRSSFPSLTLQRSQPAEPCSPFLHLSCSPFLHTPAWQGAPGFSFSRLPKGSWAPTMGLEKNQKCSKKCRHFCTPQPANRTHSCAPSYKHRFPRECGRPPYIPASNLQLQENTDIHIQCLTLTYLSTHRPHITQELLHLLPHPSGPWPSPKMRKEEQLK